MSTRPKSLSKVYVREFKELLKHVECPICNDILWNPVKCGNCSNHFCGPCILKKGESNGKCTCGHFFKPVSVEPFREDFLKRLTFNCPNKGCQEIISYSNCSEHSKTCSHELIPCISPGCNVKVLRKDLQDHFTNQCKFNTTPCKYCMEPISKVKIEEHELDCPKKLVTCEFCKDISINEYLPIHQETCPKVPEKCPKCLCEYLRQNKEKHNCFEAIREQLHKLEERLKVNKEEEKKLAPSNGVLKRMWESFGVAICPECKKMVQQCMILKCSDCPNYMCYKCLEYCRNCKTTLMCSKCLKTCPNCHVPFCNKCKASLSSHCSLLHFFNFKFTHGAYLFVYDAKGSNLVKNKFTYSNAQDSLIDSVLVDRTVYISGGKALADNSYSSEAVALTLGKSLECTQRNLTNMLEPKCFHRLIAVNHKQIFCIGGEGPKGPLKTCEVYDIKKDYWRRISRMKEPRTCPTVWSTGTSIFVVGSLNHTIISMEEYVISSNMWKQVMAVVPGEPMGLGVAATVPDGAVLIFELNGMAYEFDKETKILGQHSKMPSDKGTFIQSKPIVWKNHVYVFNNDENKGTILVYALRDQLWKQIDNWHDLKKN